MTDPRDQPPPRPRAIRVDVGDQIRTNADAIERARATAGQPDKPKPRRVTVNVIRPAVDAPRDTTPPPEPAGLPVASPARLRTIADRLRSAGLHPEVDARGLTLPDREMQAGQAMLTKIMEDDR